MYDAGVFMSMKRGIKAGFNSSKSEMPPPINKKNRLNERLSPYNLFLRIARAPGL